ncbi:geranyl diphosphate synthase-like [Euwallacea similis]|uniref:geranyl diphosphate synthase-like n=1 Tax=Euwallacea similis TaxID=1736056 RepID=UPI00344C7EE9
MSFSKVKNLILPKHFIKTNLIKSLQSSSNAPNNYLYVTPKRNFAIPLALSKPFTHNNQMEKVVGECNEVFPEFMGGVRELSVYAEVPEVLDRLSAAIDYTVPHGKLIRTIRIMTDYKRITDPEDQTPEKIHKIKMLCWFTELIHSAVLILDDIMDKSNIRRGKLAYHKSPGVGEEAVNDVYLMELYSFHVLNKYFHNHPSYETLLRVGLRNMFFSGLGQGYDSTFSSCNKTYNFKHFNAERYFTLAKYKTTFGSLTLPYELTLTAANLYSKQKYQAVQHIMVQLGLFFQVLNDFKDLFRNQGEVISRTDQPAIATDISKGQVTWFAIKVLELGNDRQKRTFMKNYGRNDPESIEAVYRIYEEMHLDEMLMDYEESSFLWLQNEIRKIDNGLPHEIFHDYVETLYKKRPQ